MGPLPSVSLTVNFSVYSLKDLRTLLKLFWLGYLVLFFRLQPTTYHPFSNKEILIKPFFPNNYKRPVFPKYHIIESSFTVRTIILPSLQKSSLKGLQNGYSSP